MAKAIEGLGQLSVTKSESVLKNDSLIGLLSAVSTAMAWVALLMGVLMVLNTLLMAVRERTREICMIVMGVAGSRLLSAIPAIGRYIAVSPTPGLIAITAVAAIILGILGSLYPAIATRASPAEALERA